MKMLKGERIFQDLQIPRAGSRSLGYENPTAEDIFSHIPSIPTPDYQPYSHSHPSLPPSPPTPDYDREGYSHARNIWGNADRYKGTISQETDQSAEVYREIISAVQSVTNVAPPFSRYRMLGYGEDVGNRLKTSIQTNIR